MRHFGFWQHSVAQRGCGLLFKLIPTQTIPWVSDFYNICRVLQLFMRSSSGSLRRFLRRFYKENWTNFFNFGALQSIRRCCAEDWTQGSQKIPWNTNSRPKCVLFPHHQSRRTSGKNVMLGWWGMLPGNQRLEGFGDCPVESWFPVWCCDQKSSQGSLCTSWDSSGRKVTSRHTHILYFLLFLGCLMGKFVI